MENAKSIGRIGPDFGPYLLIIAIFFGATNVAAYSPYNNATGDSYIIDYIVATYSGVTESQLGEYVFVPSSNEYKRCQSCHDGTSLPTDTLTVFGTAFANAQFDLSLGTGQLGYDDFEAVMDKVYQDAPTTDTDQDGVTDTDEFAAATNAFDSTDTPDTGDTGGGGDDSGGDDSGSDTTTETTTPAISPTGNDHVLKSSGGCSPAAREHQAGWPVVLIFFLPLLGVYIRRR